jgi:hypothetical protein
MSWRHCGARIRSATGALGLVVLAAFAATPWLLDGRRAAESPITDGTRFVAIGTCAAHAAALLTPGFVEIGIGEALGALSYSTRTSGLPKKGVKPHGLAIGIATNFLSAPHSRDFDMLFDFRRTLRTSAYVVGLSSALAACGGGKSGGDEDTARVSSVSTSTTDSGATGIPSGTDTSAIAAVVSPTKPAQDDSSAVASATEVATAQSTITGGDAVATVITTITPTAVVTPVPPVAPVATPQAATPSRSGIGMNLGMLNT